jgi:hypothetical protein
MSETTPLSSPASSPASSLRADRRSVLWLALLAWLLNLYFYSGFFASDDYEYLGGIIHLATGRPIDPSLIAQMRLMVIGPAAIVYGLFGSIPLTILSYTLYHPILVGLTYALGVLAFDSRSAVLGALLVALSPVFYVYGGAVLPDNTLSVWLAALLVFTIWTRVRAGELSPRGELLQWLCVGTFTGLAYSAKEPGIVVAVPLAIGILCMRLRDGARWRALAGALAYGVGVLLFMLFEALILRTLTGSWIVRLLSGVGSAESMHALEQRVRVQGLWPLDRLRFWYQHSGEFLGYGLPVFLFAQLGAWPLLRARGALPDQRRYVPFLLGFWLWLFAYLSFGTTNFTHYLPPPLQHPRYFSVCLVPALLITAAVARRCVALIQQRLPAGQALARALPVLPVLLVVLWGTRLFLHFEPDSAGVYAAEQAKSVFAAFEDARRIYPERPVLLSERLTERFQALLESRGCSACAHIVTHVNSLAELPERPFVALLASDYYHDTLGPVITRLRRAKKLELEAIGRGTYLAARGRRGGLREALYPLLSEFSEPDWPASDASQAVRLYLVSDVADAH